MAMTAFVVGVSGLKKPYEKIFFQNIRKVDTNLYIWKSNGQFVVGFKTFYCGVNTFIPKEFKKCWISDHHFMSVYYRIGMHSVNIVPYNGEVYQVQFRRSSVPWNCSPEAIHSFLSEFKLLNGINSWIDLFYSNNDERILVEQGFIYPEFKIIDRDILTDFLRLYQMQFNFKKIAEAREKFASNMEKIISSMIIG